MFSVFQFIMVNINKQKAVCKFKASNAKPILSFAAIEILWMTCATIMIGR